jgi:hypothetical protein
MVSAAAINYFGIYGFPPIKEVMGRNPIGNHPLTAFAYHSTFPQHGQAQDRITHSNGAHRQSDISDPESKGDAGF